VPGSLRARTGWESPALQDMREEAGSRIPMML